MKRKTKRPKKITNNFFLKSFAAQEFFLFVDTNRREKETNKKTNSAFQMDNKNFVKTINSNTEATLSFAPQNKSLSPKKSKMSKKLDLSKIIRIILKQKHANTIEYDINSG